MVVGRWWSRPVLVRRTERGGACVYVVIPLEIGDIFVGFSSQKIRPISVCFELQEGI